MFLRLLSMTLMEFLYILGCCRVDYLHQNLPPPAQAHQVVWHDCCDKVFSKPELDISEKVFKFIETTEVRFIPISYLQDKKSYTGVYPWYFPIDIWEMNTKVECQSSPKLTSHFGRYLDRQRIDHRVVGSNLGCANFPYQRDSCVNWLVPTGGQLINLKVKRDNLTGYLKNLLTGCLSWSGVGSYNRSFPATFFITSRQCLELNLRS